MDHLVGLTYEQPQQMSVKDCITAYHLLSRDIFEGPWRPKAWKLSKSVLGMTGDAEIRSHRLEEAICQIVTQYLPPEEKSAAAGDEEFDPRKVPLVRKIDNIGSTCHT